jgi:Mlc titration factor MtfA (ptsG expression regulator)
MNYDKWDDEIARGGWGTGGNRREMLADWRADLNELRLKLESSREKTRKLEKEIQLLKQQKP